MPEIGEFFPDPQAPQAGLPPGEHISEAEKVESRTPKKDANGTMLVFEFRVVHGPHYGKRFTIFMCVRYPSKPDTEATARAALLELSNAAIGRQTNESADLLYKPVVVVVGKNTGDPKFLNVVAYRPVPPGTQIDARRRVMPGMPGEQAALTANPTTPPVDALSTPGRAIDPAVARTAMIAAKHRSAMRPAAPCVGAENQSEEASRAATAGDSPEATTGEATAVNHEPSPDAPPPQ